MPRKNLPARLQHPNGHDQTPLNRELLAAIKEADGTFAMAPGEGDTKQSLRTIELFYFHSFHVASLKTKKGKTSAAAKRRVASVQGSASGTSPSMSLVGSTASQREWFELTPTEVNEFKAVSSM